MIKIIGIIDESIIPYLDGKTNIIKEKHQPKREAVIISECELTMEEAEKKFKDDLGIEVSRVVFLKLDFFEAWRVASDYIKTKHFENLSFAEKHQFMQKYNIRC